MLCFRGKLGIVKIMAILCGAMKGRIQGVAWMPDFFESMEKNVKKQKKHVISTVQAGSIAEELELVPGDALLRVNGQ